ncbi:hypothetical protein MHBO_000600 [Bonamia ostreae]|uniref:Uncharacterized protein n=1 Tax=Bonamia ostreae TaxID=126728 RepID=A0ABV2AG49_9EUKA
MSNFKTSEKSLNTMKKTLENMTEKIQSISLMDNLIVSEIMVVHSVLYFIAFTTFCYFATGLKQTFSVRLKLIMIGISNFVVEKVFRSVYANIDVLKWHKFVFVVRFCALIASLLLLFQSIVHYKDYVKESYILLKNNVVKEKGDSVRRNIIIPFLRKR